MTTPVSKCIYNRFGDGLLDGSLATPLLVSCTLATGYTLDWVRDRDAAQGILLVETSGIVQFTLASPAAPALFGLFNSNIAAGVTITLMAKSSNPAGNWSSPDFSHAFVQAAWRADRFSNNYWKDLTTLNSTAYTYWAVKFDTNTVPVFVGDIYLGSTVRSFGIQWNDKPRWARPQVQHQTAFKKLRSPVGTSFREKIGNVPAPATSSLKTDLRDWVLEVDGRPFFFVSDDAASPADAWLAIHTDATMEFQGWEAGHGLIPLGVEEDGPGREPTPSPLT